MSFLVVCFGSIELATAPLLSQYSVIADCAEGTTSRSNRKFLSQITSLATSKAATYSASMLETTMQDCFTLLQLRASLSIVNTNLEVDFLASLSD